MSLPDITFTNNVGSVTFKRVMLDIADEWEWDGQSVVHSKRVSMDAWISRDTSERVDGILTANTNSGKSIGLRGNLVLPWTTLANMRPESFDMGAGGWQDMVEVNVSFVDDRPQNNVYTLSFFDLTLNNPRLQLPIPSKRTKDYYAQIPYTPIADVANDNPFYGPIRYRTGYEVMNLELSGYIALDDGLIPNDIVAVLQQRLGVTPKPVDLAGLPDGYPIVFKLSDAIPEIKKDLAISSVWVSGATLTWNIEQQMAQVRIQMVTQPQAWGDS